MSEIKKELDGIIAELSKPIPKHLILRRKGPGGKMLDYITARTVQDRLNECCVWTNKFSQGPEGTVACELSIILSDGKVLTRSDGAGETQIEGEKGVYSDAFKRAAVKFGVGRHLYPDPMPNLAKEGLKSAREDAAQEAVDNGKAVEWINKLKASINDAAKWETKLSRWKGSADARAKLEQKFPTLAHNLSDWWDDECTAWERKDELG